MIKGILFDYAGVIGLDAYWDWLNHKVPDLDAKRAYFHEISNAVDCCDISAAQFVAAIAQQVGRPSEEVESEILARMHLYPEVIEFMATLKQNYKIGILSNFIYSWLHPFLKNNNVYQHLDDAVISTEVKLRKPYKEIYLLALERLKIRAEEAVFIDDREPNLVPARELGMKTLLVASPGQLVKELPQKLAQWNADPSCPSFCERQIALA